MSLPITILSTHAIARVGFTHTHTHIQHRTHRKHRARSQIDTHFDLNGIIPARARCMFARNITHSGCTNCIHRKTAHISRARHKTCALCG